MSDSFDYDLLCIGSGPAGQRGAVQAAKLGKRTAVVERRRCLGGMCIETGTIPSKTLREAALQAMRAQDRFGSRARVGPESAPTAEQLLARVNQVVAREAEVVERQLARNGVTLLHGHAAFADPHTVTVTTEVG